VPGDLSKGTVFAVLDISDRKKYEQQLEESQAQLEAQVAQRTADLSAALDAAKRADQAKDAFLANVSHELRTPLNAVIGLSSLARRTSTEPVQQDQLNKVIGAGKTLASLINDLLDLSKIVAGRMELECTTFSLRSVVHRCNSVISYRAAEKGLKLVEWVDEEVPDALVGDPLRLEQILLNMLSNAVKFTAIGQVEIRILLQPATDEKITLKIEVEDSGVGMSDVQIGQLFQPFTQADPSMSRKYGGTGLGLAICKNLVEMMGGEIGVRSRAGQGSTFYVSLCFDRGNAEDIAAPEAPGGEETLRYRDVKILVVDDQPLNREIVEALLRLVGISTRMAADGQEALDVLAESGPEAFDLVLMDIQMPVMDGLTATRLLRSRKGFEAIPIVAMTAHTMTHEKEQSAAAGMNDHIGKPFDNAGFYRTLARWIPSAKQQVPVDAAPPVIVVAADLGSLSGVDCAAGLSRLAGNEARYRHWLLAFVEEGPASVMQIRQALDAGNNEAARQLAHALKGRVGMLGMDAVHVVASGAEAALKSGALAADLIDELARAVAQLSAQITAALGVAPAAPVLVAMLDASDGGSAAALAACLEEMKDSSWAPRLQQALAQAQDFDFVAARETLRG
jgi:two-component system sensor histidine kinase/response regulator